MTRRLLICIICLLLTSAVRPQTDQGKPVRVLWGPDENCHSANSREVKADSPKCSLVNVGDENFRIIFFREISFAISSKYFVVGKRNYVRSTVQLTNGSGSEVQTDPKIWGVYHYAREADLLDGTGDPRIIKTTRASNVKLPRRVTVVDATTPGGPGAATQDVARVEVVKPSGQLTAKDRAAIQEVKPFGTTPAVKIAGSTITSGPSQEVRKNELVKKRVAAGAKAAGYIFFLDVPRTGFVVTFIRLKDIELVFPI